ncbi:SRPBCC family protein [Kutzneria sp. NPDC051319]|uniref:SRPBCC family protein n=1 Tax=Kutzneria sp. NPDC051319 TaxID=3155047 RepID=UPI00341BDEEF
MTVKHSTFTIDRTYPQPPAKVFAAFADPATKASWLMAPGHHHELDFRVGGTEIASGGQLRFEATYRDIVDGERIVYVATLHDGDKLSTVSQTTVEFVAEGEGTRLVLAEQGTYLDDMEQPEWREQGVNSQLDTLAKVLAE